MGFQSITRLPPAFHQASSTIQRYPFILLGEELRGTMEVNRLAQEHNTITWPGLAP